VEFEKTYSVRHRLWQIRQTFGEQQRKWYGENFRDQDAAAVVATVGERATELVKLKLAFGRDAQDEVHAAATAEVNDVKRHAPLIAALGNPAMQQKHWVKVWSLCESPPATVQHFTLQTLLNQGIDAHLERVEEISASAVGEASILKTVAEIAAVWEETFFAVRNYRDTKDRFMLAEVEELQTLLEDHQMTVQTSMGSKHVAEIRTEVEAWEKRLGYISDCLDEWLVFQKAWMYLENIFNAEDIRKQLAKEADLFTTVDKFWKDTMLRTKKTPLVTEACGSDALLGKFQSNNARLDEIQKGLEDYLETKRGRFPRFYFLSNDELLEILSQTRNAQAVQPHLRKCFDAISSCEFGKEAADCVEGMWGPEGEYVRFTQPVFARGAVEDWLGEIERRMRSTLFDETKSSLEAYPENALERSTWLFDSCAQAILTVDQVCWTAGVTAAIEEISKGKNKKALEEFFAFSVAQINAMVTLVRGDLTALQRNEMGALIVIDVHAKEVVDHMVKVRVDNVTAFDWTCRLRYYWEPEEEEEDVFARQTNTRFRYGYEYLGNGPRLVITPLTDKCYVTLTGALHLNFGGSPQGPAGTGKTETTKDLAKALAIQCVVFNCSDGLDFKMMARFFSGLA
jgi:dynein heavy chain